MNTLVDLLNAGLAEPALSEVVGRIGWALIHFLWQGAAIAGLLWLALRLLARRGPQVRYAVACLALLLMAAAPVATFFVVQPAGQDVRRPAHTSAATYPDDDSWGKGTPLKVPAEFREGTATLEQAKAWCRAMVVGSSFGNGHVIEVEHRELVPGGEQAVVVFDPSCGGSGGRGPQLIFSRTPTGLKFLGDLSGSWRAAPPDALGRPRLVGYWRLGGGEGKASLIVLTSRGFVPVAHVDASGGDGAADEQKRTWRTLFEEPVSQKTLAATFGEESSSRTSLPDMEKEPDLAAATAGPVADDAAESGDGQHWTSRVSAWVEPTMPYAVAVWLAGVLACSVWHVGGWLRVQRLRRGAQPLADGTNEGHWRAASDRLSNMLGVRRAVRLLKLTGGGARDLAGPVVVGVLRPAVVIPAAVLTGLTPSQVEAVLAHELAHIRRHDYFINLLQTLVETLLFYHPAVWWASARIRAERENCCDDLAASAVGDSHAYAAALAALAEVAVAQQPVRPAGILARLVPATRGRCSSTDRIAPGAKTNLLSRIRRLLGVEVGSSPRWTAALAGVILLTGLLAGIAFYGCARGTHGPDPTSHGMSSAGEETPPAVEARIVNWIELVDKDDLPAGMYCRVPPYRTTDHPGAKWVYKHTVDAMKRGAGDKWLVMSELSARLGGVYTARGTLEVAEQFVQGDTITIRLRYIDEDKDIGRHMEAGNPVHVYGDKQFKSVYLWGHMPKDLPPGKYTVNLELDEYDRKDGQLVPAPFESRTRAVRHERLKCTFVVPKPATDHAGPPMGEAQAMTATAELAKAIAGRMPANWQVKSRQYVKLSGGNWPAGQAVRIVLERRSLNAAEDLKRGRGGEIGLAVMIGPFSRPTIPDAVSQAGNAPELGTWRGCTVFGFVAGGSDWPTAKADILAAMKATDVSAAESQPATAWMKQVRKALPKGWSMKPAASVPGVGKPAPGEAWVITRDDPMRVIYSSPVGMTPEEQTLRITIVAGPKVSADDYRRMVEFNKALGQKFRGNDGTLRLMGELFWWEERTEENTNRPYLLPTHFDDDHSLSIVCKQLHSSYYEFKSKEDKVQASEVLAAIAALFQSHAAALQPTTAPAALPAAPQPTSASSVSDGELLLLDFDKAAHDAILRLLSAAYGGELDTIKIAVEAEPAIVRKRCPLSGMLYDGLDLRAPGLGTRGQMLLHAAALGGRKAMVEYLLSKGAEADAVDVHGRTPLHYTAMAPPMPPLEPGGVWDGQKQKEFEASAYAAQKALLQRRGEVAAILLQHGARIDQADKSGRTALAEAAAVNNRIIAEFLLRRGAALDTYSAAHLGMSDRLAAMLEKDRPLVDKIGPGGMTVIDIAAKRGDVEMIRRLNGLGADVTGKGRTNAPLAWAVVADSVEAVALLLKAGADPNRAAHYGSPALCVAAERGQLPIVKLLVEAGADLSASGANSSGPLSVAVWWGRKEIVDYLLDNGADINARHGASSFTPLMGAVFRDRHELAGHLLSRGAKLDVFSAAGLGMIDRLGELLRASPGLVRQTDACKDSPYENGQGTPLHWAAKFGQIRAAERLLNHGAEINVKAGFGTPTPLHVAASAGRAEMVAFLLKHGAEVDARQGHENHTPLSLAVQHKDNDKVVQVLLNHDADPLAIVGARNAGRRVIDGPRLFGDVDRDGRFFSYDTSNAYELLRQHVEARPANGRSSTPATQPADARTQPGTVPVATRPATQRAMSNLAKRITSSMPEGWELIGHGGGRPMRWPDDPAMKDEDFERISFRHKTAEAVFPPGPATFTLWIAPAGYVGRAYENAGVTAQESGAAALGWVNDDNLLFVMAATSSDGDEWKPVVVLIKTLGFTASAEKNITPAAAKVAKVVTELGEQDRAKGLPGSTVGLPAAMGPELPGDFGCAVVGRALTDPMVIPIAGDRAHASQKFEFDKQSVLAGEPDVRFPWPVNYTMDVKTERPVLKGETVILVIRRKNPDQFAVTIRPDTPEQRAWVKEAWEFTQRIRKLSAEEMTDQLVTGGRYALGDFIGALPWFRHKTTGLEPAARARIVRKFADEIRILQDGKQWETRGTLHDRHHLIVCLAELKARPELLEILERQQGFDCCAAPAMIDGVVACGRKEDAWLLARKIPEMSGDGSYVALHEAIEKLAGLKADIPKATGNTNKAFHARDLAHVRMWAEKLARAGVGKPDTLYFVIDDTWDQLGVMQLKEGVLWYEMLHPSESSHGDTDAEVWKKRWRFLPAGKDEWVQLDINQSMSQLRNLAVSPDRKYLAMLTSGEGHPILDIFDLTGLLEKRAAKPLHTVDPYPGWVEIIGLREGKVAVRSDAPLDDPKRAELPLAKRKLLPKARVFLLESAKGTFTKAEQ